MMAVPPDGGFATHRNAHHARIVRVRCQMDTFPPDQNNCVRRSFAGFGADGSLIPCDALGNRVHGPVTLSIAGHVSRAMLSWYSLVRIEAKRRALDEIAARRRAADKKRRVDADSAGGGCERVAITGGLVTIERIPALCYWGLVSQNAEPTRFAFCNPLDVASGQQIGSNYDPTGNHTQGRVTVVFRGNWAQATGIARTNVKVLELVEVV